MRAPSDQLCVAGGCPPGRVPLVPVLPLPEELPVPVVVVVVEVSAAPVVVSGTGAVVDMAGLAPPLLLVAMSLPVVVEPVWIVSVDPAVLSASFF